MSRVKVYKLSSDAVWVDLGTGNVVVSPFTITVISETDNTVLLSTTIVKEEIYHRQQETLIVWQEHCGANLALSFQDPEGCNSLWDTILSDQAKLGDSLNLPVPDTTNVKAIETIVLTASRTFQGRDQLSHQIVKDNYIEKLIPVFDSIERIATDLESEEALEDLYALSTMLKTLLFLNEATIFETVLREDLFMGVVGILEYDREFKTAKANHRNHLKNNAKFKMIVPLEQSIIDRIKLTYRISFLKDVVLARLLDDGTFSMLNSFSFMNYFEIVSYIHQNEEFLGQLFRLLETTSQSMANSGNDVVSKENRDRNSNIDSSTEMIVGDDMEKYAQVIFFLKELCGIAKNLQVANRAAFYKSLCNHGLLNIFSKSLTSPDVAVRLASTSILSNILDHDPSLLRTFAMTQVNQKEENDFITLLIERFLVEPESGIRGQLAENLKCVIDGKPDLNEAMLSSTPSDNETEVFLGRFYELHMSKLMAPLLNLKQTSEQAITATTTTSTSSSKKTSSIQKQPELVLDRDQADVLNHLCEILRFAINNHTYHAKYYILGQKIADKILCLLNVKDSYLRLSSLRFFRTCIGAKEDFYNRHLIKHNIFKPILISFMRVESKYNLYNSACLEFFEFIRSEQSGGGTKSILDHLREKCKDVLESLKHIETFRLILNGQSEMVQQKTGGSGSIISGGGGDNTTSSTLLADGKESMVGDNTSKVGDGDDGENGSSPSSLSEFDSNHNNNIKTRKKKSAPPPSGSDGWSKIDREEEDYFNTDNGDDEDDDDEHTSSEPISNVYKGEDYNDDEEKEDENDDAGGGGDVNNDKTANLNTATTYNTTKSSSSSSSPTLKSTTSASTSQQQQQQNINRSRRKRQTLNKRQDDITNVVVGGCSSSSSGGLVTMEDLDEKESEDDVVFVEKRLSKKQNQDDDDDDDDFVSLLAKRSNRSSVGGSSGTSNTGSGSGDRMLISSSSSSSSTGGDKKGVDGGKKEGGSNEDEEDDLVIRKRQKK